MRPEVLCRYYRTFTYQPVDRVPDIEFGYWPQTIRRWLREGMKLDLTPEEQQQMFCPKVDQYLRHEERHEAGLSLRWGMHPPFEEKIIERREKSVIMVDGTGCLAERYQADVDESSIPHFLKFPVQTPEDWQRLKAERYRLDDPWRVIPPAEIENVRRQAAAGCMVTVCTPGPYGALRGWLGFENLSLAFYEFPEMVQDMVSHLSALAV